ncbi:TonB-dependent receptor [Sphingomonas sp. CROZ-RG-20F-R02-07]|uniref:TonB-dependent receptor n=1 Tax=Sphingomonas sp. CROZ-RG-20F-R02-07 TaxID=2914832 RepID=UPI001F578524|nr:TonB-dependent receptor [Sphingomonas sp. CROZ-RG-20F-R02-07]
MKQMNMSGRTWKPALAGGCALAAILTTPSAHAQTAEQAQGEQPAALAAQGAAAPEQADSATDIVVTARKRSEYARDVPIAVTAILGAQLQAKNITQIIDLASVTPNFQFSYGAVQPFIFIRGFGSGANASFEQSVGKFVDNVSFGRDQDGRIPIFDVERLEVLKGPQVIAFGNSATVGALNITTRKPGASFAADGSIGYEFNEHEVQAQGGVTAPLADWASLRVAGLFQDLAHGQLYNPLLGRNEPTVRNWAVRPTLRLTPAPGLEIMLHGEYDHVRTFGNAVQPIAQPLRPGALLYPEVNDPDVRRNDFERSPTASSELSGMNAQLYQGDIRYDVLGGTLASTTAFRKTLSVTQFGTEGPNDSQPYFNSLNQRYQQFSQELRFNGTFGALDASLGAYYQRDTLHINLIQEFQLAGYGLTGAAATPFGRIATYDQRTSSYSGFADLTYRLTSALSVAAGVRYSHIDKTAGQAIFAAPIIPGLGLYTSRDELLQARSEALAPLLSPVTGSTEHTFPFGALALAEDHWQPQVIVQYKLDPTNNVYAKYVKGDKVGGFDFLYAGTDPNAARFRPEEAQSVEVGFKGLVLNRKLEYAIDIYRTTFTSLQQSVFSNLVFVVSNVGKARSQGVEADVTLRPVTDLRIGLGGSYLDAKFIDFPGAACNSVENLATPRGCSQNLSNTPTQYASKWTGTASIDYQRPIGSGTYKLGGGLSVLARSKYNAGAYNDPRMVQPGYAQLDGHLDLLPTDGIWTLSLFARNLTDKRVLDYAVLAPAQSTAIFGTYGRERQIGLRVSVNVH